MKKEELEKRILRLERLLKETLGILSSSRYAYDGSREFERYIKILEADTDFVEEQKICPYCGESTYHVEDFRCEHCRALDPKIAKICSTCNEITFDLEDISCERCQRPFEEIENE